MFHLALKDFEQKCFLNVKLYDGSTQEWAADANAPMVKYSWK